MEDLELIYRNMAGAAENPQESMNYLSCGLGALAGFLVNSVPKEAMDRKGKTEEWSRVKRFLGGNFVGGTQIVSADHIYDQREASTWFKTGYAAGSGITYSLPERNEINEYLRSVSNPD
jgi:hypothetical protein